MKPIVSPHRKFSFDGYRFNPATGEALLTYSIDDAFSLTERLVFPMPQGSTVEYDARALDRALFALHLACGVSYYKAFLPPDIVVRSGSLTSEQADFWSKLYTLGLGEFFYRNQLDFVGHIKFPAQVGVTAPTPVSFGARTQGAVVPLGGGKDSLVVAQMLMKSGVSFDLVSLRRHQRIDEVARSLGRPLAVIERTLDPQLFDLNARGAWNGHVPISSIVIFASVVYAILHGKQDVVLANERSANVGNLVVDGVEINHQYSKSLEFERDAQGYIGTFITPDVRYFSLLRPLSELAIVRKFVEFGRHFEVFSSCNKNFKMVGPLRQVRWCGKCPKCAFVFALFAAFLPPGAVISIFGGNLFDDVGLIQAYRDLLGCGAGKPFECVGEPDEVMAALELARRGGFYGDTPVLRWFVSEILPGQKDLDAKIKKALTPSADHALPEQYVKIAYAD